MWSDAFTSITLCKPLQKTVGKLPLVISKLNGFEANFWYLLIGVVLLTVALLLSSRLGIYQEQMYQTYGKHPMEAMYYCVGIL